MSFSPRVLINLSWYKGVTQRKPKLLQGAKHGIGTLYT